MGSFIDVSGGYAEFRTSLVAKRIVQNQESKLFLDRRRSKQRGTVGGNPPHFRQSERYQHIGGKTWMQRNAAVDCLVAQARTRSVLATGSNISGTIAPKLASPAGTFVAIYSGNLY
uniref:(northern house mosquito) hypothetical protein n=1 Tax=Culex pipiens TaxID=7175 RepID=A0A8D8HJF8_CULPI